MKIRGVVTAAGLSIAVSTGVTAVAQARVNGKQINGWAKAARVTEASLGLSSYISPNGAYFVTTSTNAAGIEQLRLYSRRGVKLMSYSTPDSPGASPSAWSRDSRYLAVSAAVKMTDGATVDELAIIDTHTLKAKIVVPEEVGNVSFAPAGSGKPASELVFDESSLTSQSVNLFETSATGGAVKQLTTNGVSAMPVWGRRGIFFDRLTFNSNVSGVFHQLWLLSGGKARQLTHIKITSSGDGVTPIAVSANGNRLIAASGAETIGWTAWEIQLSPFISTGVAVPGTNPMLRIAYPEAISKDGTKLLVYAAANNKRSSYVTEWVPFGGGKAHKLTNGKTEANWNW